MLTQNCSHLSDPNAHSSTSAVRQIKGEDLLHNNRNRGGGGGGMASPTVEGCMAPNLLLHNY